MRTDTAIVCFVFLTLSMLMLCFALLNYVISRPKHKHEWENVFYYTVDDVDWGRKVDLRKRATCKICNKTKDKVCESHRSIYNSNIKERIDEYRSHGVRSIEETL